MAEAFLGLKVSVLLHSGIKLEGVVSQLEPSNQQMTLKDGEFFYCFINTFILTRKTVTLFFFGQPPHRTPIYGVVGKDIKDLQVINTPSTTTTTTTTPPSTTTIQPLPLDHHVLEQDPPPKVWH